MTSTKNIVFMCLFVALFFSLHLNNLLWLFFVSFFALALIVACRKKPLVNYNVETRVFGLLFIIPFACLLFEGNIYGTYRIYLLLAFWLLFFIFTILFNRNKILIKYGFGIIVSTIGFEIILGFGQMFGWISNNDTLFVWGGSFGNPNAYAGYLSVVSPLILSVLLSYKRNKKSENLYYLLLACFVFILYLLVMSKSRAAWIATAFGCILIFNYRYAWARRIGVILETPLRKIVAGIGIMLFIVAGAYALYQFKADSAFGRLLVWKIVSEKTNNRFMFGDGFGSVEANYGKWQSAYFTDNGGTEAERYVADYVTCAYNDFMEMHVEQGFIVMILFIGIAFGTFGQKRKSYSSLLAGAKASFAAILILMCVSYPLKIPAVFLYMVFCLAVIYSMGRGKIAVPQKAPVFQWGKFVLFFFCLLVTLGASRYIYGYHWLSKGQKFVFSGQLDKGIEAYKKAKPTLKNNGTFHFYYGSALAQKQAYKTSAEELEKAVQKSSDPNAYTLLGNTCKELGEYEKAKRAYLTVINMIPSKLYPKYLLAKLLIERNEYEEAEKWAREILSTKEKVPTTAAKEIKEEMESFLDSQ